MTPLVAYVLLFVAVGIGFIFVHLMAGKLIRPNNPDASKGTIYECGEPTIGSAWIQFDLRFYVVALLFVIFDVEVAFFFPWAEVFGKANALVAVGEPTNAEQYHRAAELTAELIPPAAYPEHAVQIENMKRVTPEDVARLRELQGKRRELDAKRIQLQQERPNAELSAEQVRQVTFTPEETQEFDYLAGKQIVIDQTQRDARTLAWLSLLEIVVFFGVLLVGFAYLWRRGDLAWVRSLAAERPGLETPTAAPTPRSPAPAPLVGAGTSP